MTLSGNARRHPARRLVVVLGVVCVLLSVATMAAANFSSTTNASSSNASAVLAPPSSLTGGTGSCVANVSVSVALSWVATTSSWASGYEVLRSTTSGGPYSVVGTVNGQATTTFTDTGVAFATTYYYVVRATKINWRSANTPQATVTTPSSLCV
jgi:hypothetical protein